MKHLLRLAIVSILIPFALLAGKNSPGPKPLTLSTMPCNIDNGQACILIVGSGYVGSKNVTIQITGASTSETLVAPASSNGDIALYVYETFAPGSYLVTSYQTNKIGASTSFEVQ
ncbi:MAG: hypothetical protein EXQ47_09975 [Bryobacterales bacterium]|nr:hypothetical protein [Bryobacterales bacterium]